MEESTCCCYNPVKIATISVVAGAVAGHWRRFSKSCGRAVNSLNMALAALALFGILANFGIVLCQVFNIMVAAFRCGCCAAAAGDGGGCGDEESRSKLTRFNC
jgi:hypothetical protein